MKDTNNSSKQNETESLRITSTDARIAAIRRSVAPHATSSNRSNTIDSASPSSLLPVGLNHQLPIHSTIMDDSNNNHPSLSLLLSSTSKRIRQSEEQTQQKQQGNLKSIHSSNLDRISFVNQGQDKPPRKAEDLDSLVSYNSNRIETDYIRLNPWNNNNGNVFTTELLRSNPRGIPSNDDTSNNDVGNHYSIRTSNPSTKG